MLGKDGRPLSPLSAAMARAKAGDDIHDIERDAAEDMPSDIRPCPCCGRNFAANRLPTHLEICQKITINSQQRQTWNSQSQRINNTQTFNASPPPQRSSTSRRGAPGGLGGTGSSFRASHTPGESSERAPSRNAGTARSTDGVRSSGAFGGGG